MEAVAIASISIVVASCIIYATTLRILEHLRWRELREISKSTEAEKEALDKALDELRSRCMRLEQSRGIR